MTCEAENINRLANLINREELDRIPVIMNIGLYAAYISNITSYEYYTEPLKAYEVQLWAEKLHKDDGGLSYYIPSSDAETFGGELDIYSDKKIALPKVKKRIVENMSDVDKLKMPILNKSKYTLNKLKFDKLLFEKGRGVSFSSGSPMSVAGNIVNIELLMRWMYKAPELVHRILRISTNYLLELADLYIEEFGAENCVASSSYPIECHSLISPKMFEKFSLPYITEIHKKLISKGINQWSIHLCGDHTKNLKYWKNDIKLYPRSLITIGDEMDIETVSKVFEREHIIGGNINTSLLQSGTANEVYEECRSVIQKMKYREGGFLLTPACSLPAQTPPINVHALLEAANVFGKYD